MSAFSTQIQLNIDYTIIPGRKLFIVGMKFKNYLKMYPGSVLDSQYTLHTFVLEANGLSI